MAEKVELIIDGNTGGAQSAVSGLNAKTVALGNIMADVARMGASLLGEALKNVKDQGLKAIQAAAEQEKAEITLGSAMKQAGTFTEQAFKHNLAYASSLQQMTTFGDEAIVGVQKILSNFKLEGEVLDKTTKAVLDLAAAKGMDLNAAADLVGKSIGSSTNALSRYAIEVTGAAGSTERATMAVENITKLFGGSAQAEAKSFNGQITQMSNAWGDLYEEVGNAVVKNKGMAEVFAILKDAIMQATDWVRAHQEQLAGLVKDGLVAVVKGLGWVVRGINFLSWTWTELGNIALAAFQKIIEGIKWFLDGIGKIVPKAKEWGAALGTMVEATKEEISESEKAQEKRALILDGIVEGIDKVAKKIQEVPALYDPVNEALKNTANAQQEAVILQEESTNQLIELARGYTDKELEEYERRKQGLFNLANTGMITWEQYNNFVATAGAKFVATSKKSSEEFKNNWQMAWSSVTSASNKASDEILKGQTTFGTGLENAAKEGIKGYLKAQLDGLTKSIALKAAEQIGLAELGGFLSFGATLLMIPLIAAASVAAQSALGGILGFADGGMLGSGGRKLPLPSFESIGSGAPHTVIAHEGEVIGTPERLAGAGIGGVTVYFENYAPISSELSAEDIGKSIGKGVKNELRGSM